MLKLHEFYAGFSNSGTVEINNALMAATPRHSLIYEARKLLKQRCHKSAMMHSIMRVTDPVLPFLSSMEKSTVIECSRQLEASTITRDSGPGSFTIACMNALQSATSGNVMLYPNRYFYPVSNSGSQHHSSLDQSYAIHHWACSWQRPR